MTKKEAIEYGKQCILWNKFSKGSLLYEFIEMAISALEKENIYDDKEHYVTISKALYDKLNVDACDDCVSREAVRQGMLKYGFTAPDMTVHEFVEDELPSVHPTIIHKDRTVQDFVDKCLECGRMRKGHWIPVSKRLPENNDPVNITWVNHNPKAYYADVKDEPFTATGRYCNGQWWWDSVVCGDYLDEYGRSDCDAMDEYIEVIAWMPIPEPYKNERGEE